MLQRLVQSHLDGIELQHVRLAFSRSMDEVGRFQLGKVFHLLSVILRVCWLRVFHGTDILYYPPAGPHRVPMWRDIMLLICTRWMFRRTIFHMHAGGISSLLRDLSPPVRWLFRRAYFYPDAVIRMSDRTPNDARGLCARAEFLVPNCADDEWEAHRQLRERWPTAPAQAEQKPLRLLYLGTLCETKGVLDLLEACQRLSQAGTRFELHLVGSFQPAGFESILRRRLEALGLTADTVIHGQLTGSDKFAMFATADVFCMPTFYESEAFPCVLLEAMSFGLPVVASRWRGIPSIVDDAVTGYLVEPHDVAGLADRLRELAGEPETRHQFGMAGRQKFLREYTVEQHLDLMRYVFLTVGNGKVHVGQVERARRSDSKTTAPAHPAAQVQVRRFNEAK